MSAPGLEVFDQTLQKTNVWLKEIMAHLGPDRQRAYHALRAVLHTLRDRLTWRRQRISRRNCRS